jgi:CRP-like cAMP-binding protein
MFEVRVDDRRVGHVGPGAVVGERAGLEGGRRTATVRAETEGRVAETTAEQVRPELLMELAAIHRREEVV